MKVKHYFTTPIMHEQTDAQTLCDHLHALIVSHMEEKNRIEKPPQSAHPDLFESNFDFLNWPQPEVQQLKSMMLKYLFGFLQEVNQFSREQMAQLRFRFESWFHVARNGGYFQTHTHPNHAWSMVFCVNPGDEQPANDFEAGKMLLMDPRLNAAMYLDPANKDMKREYSFNGLKLHYKKGTILIFPSYLQHSVEPYRGEESRITVAANFSFFYQ
ncbi:putative 2OG-Fe(II) oxygenase [Marinicella sp. W31]|uniref:putative 2OG-Fe(II) oxygenase n=1 Tax=Marinicella sp. W31 TaxID=3023713 RepID=UPI003756A4BF